MLFKKPDKPVIMTNFSLGISTERFFKLCSLAPLTIMFLSIPVDDLFNNYLYLALIYVKNDSI